MRLRDILNSKEGYEEIIAQRISFSTKTKQKVSDLEEDEKKGIQKSPKPNSEIIELSNWRVFEDYFTILKSKYSIGKPYAEIKKDYLDALSFFVKSWKPQSKYTQMLDMLSLGLLFEIEDADFRQLVNLLEKHNLEDKIFDYFVRYRNSNWPISERILWPKLHTSAISKIVEFESESNDKVVDEIKKYLSKWYRNLEIKTHESKWNIHSGYWCWEAGALVKILGLDDSSLKDQQYYPYDMVHWKD